MAIIKTSNTNDLFYDMRDTFFDTMDDLGSTVDAILEFADSVDGANPATPIPPVTSPWGGEYISKLTANASSVNLTTTYKDFSDDWGTQTGTVKSSMAGKNMKNPDGSVNIDTATSFTQNGKLSYTHDSGTGSETYNDRAQFAYDPVSDSLTLSSVTAASSGSSKYDDGGSDNWSDSLSFAGTAVYDLDNIGSPVITMKQISSKWNWLEKNASNKYTGQGNLSLKSKSGFTADYQNEAMTGVIDQLSYSTKHTNGLTQPTVNEHSFISSGTIQANVFDMSIDNMMEALLAGNDKITGTSKTGNFLYGGAGDDVITGNIGNDELYGGTGNDKLNGGAGHDYLSGGNGNDKLIGGAGHDYLNGDDGNDTLDGGAGDDLLEGGEGNDQLKGGAGYDTLHGGNGDDTLDGGAGNDILMGGTGNDKLIGGAGDDLLIGGAGTDTLTGGAGRDYFQFTSGDSGLADSNTLDTITDFNMKQGDKLFLDTFTGDSEDITIALGKADAKADYAALLAAANDSEQNIFVGYHNGDKKNAYVFVDMDNNGSMDIAIKLTGVKAGKIDANSFINELPSDYVAGTMF